MSRATIHHGDLRAGYLSRFDRDSFDGVLCDPPYGLRADGRALTWDDAPSDAGGFMGNKWDSAVPGVTFWREVFRVLKPGASVLAFGGTRTYHRLACAIEDAGFRLQDSILCPGAAWIYGQGMPKGIDIARQVDALDTRDTRRERALQFTSWMRSTGITARAIQEATGSAMASHYLTAKQQPEVATAAMFDLLRPLLPKVPESIEALVAARTVESENLKRRRVIGSRIAKDAQAGDLYAPGGGGVYLKKSIDITEPYSEDAKRWDGYRTDLRPAWEPVVWAIKPPKGSYAANALKWGVAGLNIKGSAIESEELNDNRVAQAGLWGDAPKESASGDATRRRSPANVILCHLPECQGSREHGMECADGCPVAEIDRQTGGEGPASSFFYCAKVSPAERNGSTHPTLKSIDLCRYLARLILPPSREDEPRRLLVPFSGMGSEIIGALQAGWEDAVGVEGELEYVEASARRIRDQAPLLWKVETVQAPLALLPGCSFA